MDKMEHMGQNAELPEGVHPAQIIDIRDYPVQDKNATPNYRLVIYRGPKGDREKWTMDSIEFMGRAELERTYAAIGKALKK